jgi:F0F1-type ATP synthase delta subunit
MRKVDFNKYSKALLETGKESGMLDQLIADLETVCEKINENIELKKLLASLQVTFTEKKEILKAIFQDFISEKTYNFIFVLIKNNKPQ